MKIGTKSILFGAHQFAIHPWFVALAWWKLYGFPLDPRLWVAFFVHDLGYFGKPNMDGAEGETHVEFGANVMHRLFDWPYYASAGSDFPLGTYSRKTEWRDFCLYHSRFYAKRDGKPFSRLCVADKYSFCFVPRWLYLPLARMSGEIHEYMRLAKNGDSKYVTMNINSTTQNQWFADVKDYLRRWVAEHKDGRQDTWTPGYRQAVTESGVWK